MEMSARQKELARHALGLPTPGGKSYRNRFCASIGHADWPDWMAMCGLDYAIGHQTLDLPRDTVRFHLTHKGAEAALLPGETLCPRAFPAAYKGQGE